MVLFKCSRGAFILPWLACCVKGVWTSHAHHPKPAPAVTACIDNSITFTCLHSPQSKILYRMDLRGIATRPTQALHGMHFCTHLCRRILFVTMLFHVSMRHMPTWCQRDTCPHAPVSYDPLLTVSCASEPACATDTACSGPCA